MAHNLADVIAADCDRLTAERESLLAQRNEIDEKLAGIDREFAAITAYEHHKSGKAGRSSSVPAKPRTTSDKGSRGPARHRQARGHP